MQEVENEQWCSLVLMYWYKLADFDKLSLWNVFMLYNFPGFFFFSNFIYLLFLAVLGLRFCARAFSSCGEWGLLFISVCRPLTVAASFVAEHRLQTRRLSSCDSRVQLWLTGPVALRHVGSSQTRARTHVPCIGRQILNHCATREAPGFLSWHNVEMLHYSNFFLNFTPRAGSLIRDI